MVVLSGYSDEESQNVLKTLAAFHKDPAKQVLRDDFPIEFEPGCDPSFGFIRIVVGRLDHMIMRISMLNLAQSLKLFRESLHFSQQTFTDTIVIVKCNR